MIAVHIVRLILTPKAQGEMMVCIGCGDLRCAVVVGVICLLLLLSSQQAVNHQVMPFFLRQTWGWVKYLMEEFIICSLIYLVVMILLTLSFINENPEAVRCDPDSFNRPRLPLLLTCCLFVLIRR